ncbi:cytochrome c [Singulisphaera sp. PoT]|uniref:cytochrome c n=1 Tax=Singulisphaera sp. PoT TaxID=3411797 RepID=UPI003BF53F05
MIRKWMVLAVTMASVSVLAAGLSFADDDDSPVHKLMEKVGSKSNAIKKATRTAPAYKKAQKDLAKVADELIELAKESKKLAKEAAAKAKGVKDGEKKWEELNDAWTKKLEEFAATIAKPETDQAKAKSAWGTVNQSCTDCHEVFRVEDEKF